MEYFLALIKGLCVAFIGYIFCALFLSRLFENGSASSTFHALTQALVIFLTVVVVFCTSLILNAIKNSNDEKKRANENIQ